MSGTLEKPPLSSYGAYLAKEGIVGSVMQAVLIRTGEGNGNPLIAFLLGVKHHVRASFQALLPSDAAAFLSGVTLGINQDFSPSLLQAFALSGTRHLTAISGLHMAVVIGVILSICGYLLPRRYAIIITALLVFLFVALTGFSVSAIRASLMAGTALLGKATGRSYAPYTALTASALLLTLLNPRVLVFDVGFQLSFLATIAILYLAPVLRRAFRMGSDSGFVGWKESLLMTVSAELATAPILITQFHNFSLSAWVANVLVLWVVPFIMLLGFLMALLASLCMPLAVLVSFLIAPLAAYLLFVVRLFGAWALIVDIPMGFAGVVIYYGLLVGVLYWFYAAPTRLSLALKKIHG